MLLHQFYIEKKKAPSSFAVKSAIRTLGALTARGLDHFGVHDLKILKDLALPSFTEPTKLAWPPYRPVDWSSVVPVFRHSGADWASERERGAA